MPVKRCTKDGKSGFKYGDAGKCYTYAEGDQASENAAHDKAVVQGKAVERSQGNWK